MDRSLTDDAGIAGEILRQVRDRGAGRSICPSEVARALTPAWQQLMAEVRRVAIALAKSDQIEILRKGRPADPDCIKGVIRLRLRRPPSE